MVPQPIERYLHERGVPFRASTHPYRATAQQTAASAHVSGKRFAKTVVLRRDGGYLMALLPANEWVDLDELRDALGEPVDLAHEDELAGLFPECELGAMPPLGGLYGLPVYAHACLGTQGTVAVNGGTHTDLLEISWPDFVALEHPRMIEH